MAKTIAKAAAEEFAATAQRLADAGDLTQEAADRARRKAANTK